MSRRRIALGIGANMFDRLVIAGCQLALVPILAHRWGLHLYGCWVLLATMPGFLALADLGFGGAASVRMTALIAQGERDRAVVVLHTALRSVALASALVLLLAWTAVVLIPAAWLPTDVYLAPVQARLVLAILVLYALAVLQSGVQVGAFRSVSLFPLGAFAATMTYLAETLLVAVAALAGMGPVAAAAGMLLGRLGGLVAQQRLLARMMPWLRFGIARAEATEARVLAAPAMAMLAIPLGQATVLQGSVVALGAAAGPAATPAFAAARTLSRVGLQVINFVTHAVQADFTMAAARDDRPTQARLLLAVLGTAVLATTPFTLVVGFAGPWLMRLWTHGAIQPPPGLMPTMAVAVLLGGLWAPLSTMMLAVNRHAAFSYAYLLLGLFMLGATYLLAARFGATGAAMAMAALDAAMTVVVGRFVFTHWLRGLPLREALATMFDQLRARVVR